MKKNAIKINQESSFENGFQHLLLYYQQHGTALVKVAYEVGGFTLGRWASVQRSNYKAGKLTNEQIERLDALDGWAWSIWGRDWEKGVASLKKYKEREGNVRVPIHYYEDGFALGKWVARQRKRLKGGSLTQQERIELEAVGDLSVNWRLEQAAESWEIKYHYLEQYSKEHGDCHVNRHYSVDGIDLGVWVNSLRSQYSRGRLTKERIEKLERLDGWRWAEPKRKEQEKN